MYNSITCLFFSLMMSKTPSIFVLMITLRSSKFSRLFLKIFDVPDREKRGVLPLLSMPGAPLCKLGTQKCENVLRKHLRAGVHNSIFATYFYQTFEVLLHKSDQIKLYRLRIRISTWNAICSSSSIRKISGFYPAMRYIRYPVQGRLSI